jgi:hypothetical protein
LIAPRSRSMISFNERADSGEEVMKRKIDIILMGYLLLASLLFVGSARALDNNFTCGSYIIAVGDRAYDVLNKCGDPSNVESWQEVRTREDSESWALVPGKRYYIGPLFSQELVTIEEWEYDLGPNRFIRYLRFENGRLTRVTIGDYGY